MKITLEVDDNELRRVLLPLLQVHASEPTTPDLKLLTIAEVAQRLSISRTKTHQLIVRREIASISIGRSRLVNPVAVTEFVGRAQETLSASPQPITRVPVRYATAV